MQKKVGKFVYFSKQTTAMIAIAVGVLVLVFGGLLIELLRPMGADSQKTQLISVTKGMAADEVADVLHKQGLIRYSLSFRLLVKLQGKQNSLQAGDYLVASTMTPQTTLNKITAGEFAQNKITIPEGFTIAQIAALLEEKHIVGAATFKEAARIYQPFEYTKASPNTAYAAEGFLFPDTYMVGYKMKAEDVLQLMSARFDRQFTPAMREQANSRGLSIRETIIMASLVEKEAQFAEERPIIAAVFFKRLKLGMPLQSCASIQYILGYPKAELSIKDTEIVSPYNTYLNSGLPPGPIANPGLAAIKAVLEHGDTEYLYFVADKTGRHHFSKTYDEHLAAIKRIGE